jgi:hypothetical protein
MNYFWLLHYSIIRKIYEHWRPEGFKSSASGLSVISLTFLFMSLINFVGKKEILEKVWLSHIPLGPIAGFVYFIILMIISINSKNEQGKRFRTLRKIKRRIRFIRPIYGFLYFLFLLLLCILSFHHSHKILFEVK